MRIFAIARLKDDDYCPTLETARLTRLEAEEYIAEQKRLARNATGLVDEWEVTALDMPLTPESSQIMREPVAT
jgi:hypothetical protein